MYGTSGTVTAPHLDLNIGWELTEEFTKLLVIEPNDMGESGHAGKLFIVRIKQILPMHIAKVVGEQFKHLFKPIVIDIQSHGKMDKRR